MGRGRRPLHGVRDGDQRARDTLEAAVRLHGGHGHRRHGLAQGYQNIDLDTRHRMAAISAEARKNYGGNYDPSLPQHGHEAGTKSPHTEQTPTGDAGGSI